MARDRTLGMIIVATMMLTGCSKDAPQALGTLEWDRVSLPAPVAEKIVRIDVREGQQVAAGASLLQLEPVRTRAQLVAVEAQARQSRDALQELRSGPRAEAIAQAQAALAAAQAEARDARAYHARLQPLGRQQLVAASDLDRARAASDNAAAQVRAAQAALLELQHGTRVEQIAQGEAAVASAEAQAQVQSTSLEKLNIVAPRAGRVDSLPYKLGDQAPVGAPLAVLLVGEAPYARIYVPQAMRARMQIGSTVRVQLAGQEQTYAGRVRMIRSEPAFTPYFALTGQDAERLSYLAEVELGRDAATLPVGAPLQVWADDAR